MPMGVSVKEVFAELFSKSDRISLPKHMLHYRTNKRSNAGFEFEIDKIAGVVSFAGLGIDGDVAERGIEGDRYILDGDGVSVHLGLKESHDTVNDLTRAGVNEVIGQSDRVVCEGEGTLDAFKPFALISPRDVRGEHSVFEGGVGCRRGFSGEMKRAVHYRNAVTAGRWLKNGVSGIR